jgi:hypothetical protein
MQYNKRKLEKPVTVENFQGFLAPILVHFWVFSETGTFKYISIDTHTSDGSLDEYNQISPFEARFERGFGFIRI